MARGWLEGAGLDGGDVLLLGAPHGARRERGALERLVQVVEPLAADGEVGCNALHGMAQG